MGAIRQAGAVILALVAINFVAGFVIEGTTAVAGHVLPFLIGATYIAIVLCVIFLLPLSLFKATRAVSAWGYIIASYLFGIGVWMYGFLVTYNLWGGIGVVVGSILGGVGIVPLGIVAAALKGLWSVVGNLVFGIGLTFGARVFAGYLAAKVDNSLGDDPPSQSRTREVLGTSSKIPRSQTNLNSKEARLLALT